MANFGGNILCKTSSGLHYRVLLIPWMKKCSGIRSSSNGGANSSSFPVRYTPKKTINSEEPQTSSTPRKGRKAESMNSGLDGERLRFGVSNGGKSSQRSFVAPKKTIKTKEPLTSSITWNGPKAKSINCSLDQKDLRFEVPNGVKSSQRSFVVDTRSQDQNQNQNQATVCYFAHDVNKEVEEDIKVDEGVLESECFEEPEEVVEELGIYMGKNPHNQGELEVGRIKQDAEKSAIELLAKRAYTAVELRKKLQGKRFSLDTVDAVILDFQSRGLINDCLYAETFSRSRWSSSSWGPRRIKQALFKKGVSEVDAEKAVKLVFQERDSGEDEELSHGLSKVSMDQLFVQASKQWLRGRDLTNEIRKSRIVRWLQYRGFNWGVICFILKKLESQRLP